MTKRGIFICIEGIDASGKSTQARWLVRKLRRRGFDAIYTTEPSKGEVGSFIRRICKLIGWRSTTIRMS